MDTAPEPGASDTRDWTVVLNGGCAECGYTPHEPSRTGDRLDAAAARWHSVLDRDDVAHRPAPRVWSPLEYGGHCRDLIEVLGERVEAMLDTVNPTYEDFDGEAAVLAHEYWKADAARLDRDLQAATAGTRQTLGRIGQGDWQRTGRRGDGYVFSLATLCQYIVHDVEHHLADVEG